VADRVKIVEQRDAQSHSRHSNPSIPAHQQTNYYSPDHQPSYLEEEEEEGVVEEDGVFLQVPPPAHPSPPPSPPQPHSPARVVALSHAASDVSSLSMFPTNTTANNNHNHNSSRGMRDQAPHYQEPLPPPPPASDATATPYNNPAPISDPTNMYAKSMARRQETERRREKLRHQQEAAELASLQVRARAKSGSRQQTRAPTTDASECLWLVVTSHLWQGAGRISGFEGARAKRA
jgi:hypothetical protein